MLGKKENEIVKADIDTIFDSPLFRIYDFKCREQSGSASKREYEVNFCINFVRKGNFKYKIGRRIYDIYNNVVLLQNMNTEYTVTHDHHIHDECTSITIQESLLKEIANTYLSNGHSGGYDYRDFEFPYVVIPATPEIDYIHMWLFKCAKKNLPGKSLQIDGLVIHLLQRIVSRLAGKELMRFPVDPGKKKKDQHLETIDRAKKFILENCHNEINLTDIAFNSYVSIFHFSRLFKHFTSYSPYQYLLEARLSRAVLLLRHSSLSVTEICLESGFNSLEHFISTFSNHFKMSPLKFRRLKS